VSFDILRDHDPTPAYSIATLLAFLGNTEACRSGELEVLHEAFNLRREVPPALPDVMQCIARHDIARLDFIALGVYVWSEALVVGVVSALRANGYSGRIVLGGYQITATADADMQSLYPGADHFLKGYAEASLVRVVISEQPVPVVLTDRPDFAQLPSIYLNEVIPLPAGALVEMVRWETKRGCVYRCGFCEWRNAANKRLFEFPLERIEAELGLFKARHIKKINVLDATFNAGVGYLEVARRMADMASTFSVQARFEALTGRRGAEFLEICASGNIRLEFGLQTVIREEMDTIGRVNDLDAVAGVMRILNQRRIPYEVSLIYGIPGQTAKSFLETVHFVLRNGCSEIKCYPLRIPRGSEMERWSIADCVGERPEGSYSIAQVVRSFSFVDEDWQQMREIASLFTEKRCASFLLFTQRGLSWEPCDAAERLEVALAAEVGGAAPHDVTLPGRTVDDILVLCRNAEAIAGVCRIGGRIVQATLKPAGRDCLVYLHDRT
jgi:hypothetical protein